jgi:hypothetical protein
LTIQSVSAIIGNPSMTRVFSATATDGIYNNLNDSVTSTNLGLTMPNRSINYVCATMTEGCGIWRIISSQTNQIYRQGFCSKVGFVDPAECMIPALTVMPDMLFQIYTLSLDGTALQSNSLGIITTNRGREAFIAEGSIDAIPKEFTSLLSGLGVGDLLFGTTMSRVEVAVESGASLTSIILVDASGGTQYTGYGSTKLPTAGATSGHTNGDFITAIPLKKGFVLNLVTTTA